ncbi:hypothetical protein AB0N88_28410 [Streptomyces sp. NPDC093516]|uniref:hypothetical protein n=1 Tax=Streptomyces sp. NPDC093516 TaxID=3155304 RepID=UPI0034444069
MQNTDIQHEAATLLRAARTETGARREHLLEEARLWLELARTNPAAPPEEVPDGTVMRIRTRGGALTVVMEAKEAGTHLYPWTCLGCGDGRKFGGTNRKDAQVEATRHARDCWVLPQSTLNAPARPLSVA